MRLHFISSKVVKWNGFVVAGGCSVDVAETSLHACAITKSANARQMPAGRTPLRRSIRLLRKLLRRETRLIIHSRGRAIDISVSTSQRSAEDLVPFGAKAGIQLF